MNRLIACMICVAALFSGCQKEEKEVHEETPILEVSNPIIKDTTITREFVCQIHASRHIEVRALERGYLQDIYVDEGQKVTKGQRMFKIMPNVYEADLQKMKAEAEVARIEYNNTKMLADKNVVSQNELALAKAKLDKALAEVNLAETHLGFTNINAPFTGIMDHLHVREGSLLEEGELLTTLADNDRVWVYFNVPESEYLDYVSSDQNHRQKEVQLRLANGQVFNQNGVIETIEGEFNHETGNIEFRAVFPNPNSMLRHGETGSILMNTTVKDAMIIPQKATFEILDKIYVFVVNEENKLEQRQISVAQELPHLYIVDGGIDTSDKILMEGLRKVRNGQEIEAQFKPSEQVLADLRLHAE